MHIQVLQHVPFEGPAAIREWAEANNHALAITHAYRGDTLPAVTDFDWLVVMGGPMGVNDAEHHPWITDESKLIREAIDADKRVLGICLGAQLMAHALGARVHRAPEREIGWFDVTGVAADGVGLCDALPARFKPLHWHGDTFELPKGAVRLARSPACENQAFQYGPRAIGLQFHIESTPESVAQLITHCADEIGDGPWEMPPDRMTPCAQQCAATRPILDRLLRFLEAE